MRPDLDFKELRRLLEQRREQLVAREHDAREQRTEPGIDAYGYDAGDRAILDDDKSMLEQLADTDFAELRDIDEALARIEDGSYGVCAECGEAIDRGRLYAEPQTPLCAGCADRRENETDASRYPTL